MFIFKHAHNLMLQWQGSNSAYTLMMVWSYQNTCCYVCIL